MSNYPKTIDNGNGEKLTFLGVENRDGVDYLLVENVISPGGGPPMHVHHLQDERIHVVQGTLAFQVPGSEPKVLNAGESAHFKKGEMHRFWNPGTEVAKGTGEVWPVYNLEYFLTEIYRSTKANKGRPALFDTAYLLLRYRSEFDMQAIPGFVKNYIFPFVVAGGKRLGMHKKFSNAPPPVK